MIPTTLIDELEKQTGPRVTQDDINDFISSVHYFTAREGCEGACGGNGGPYPMELGLLTFCVLSLRNGFTVTGESACVSPENYSQEVGRKVAYDNAVSKVWMLLGFKLKDKINADQA
jgi:hypothetical protein